VQGLAPKNRIASAFGSFGWAGGGVKELEAAISTSGITLLQPGIAFKYVPDDSELKACFEFGKNIADKTKLNN
jgi:flavorubredoxin